jgi:hypothetical protein
MKDVRLTALLNHAPVRAVPTAIATDGRDAGGADRGTSFGPLVSATRLVGHLTDSDLQMADCRWSNAWHLVSLTFS